MVECDFPECTTFGAVIRFSLELEKGAAGIYEELAKEPKAASAAALFKELSELHKKRGTMLENMRQQKLNEMILEPIQDMNRELYLIDTNVPKGADAKAAAKFVTKVEETSARFYVDAAKIAKTIMAEGSRFMDKMGKENLAIRTKLAAL
jgi:rubrerythrin